MTRPNRTRATIAALAIGALVSTNACDSEGTLDQSTPDSADETEARQWAEDKLATMDLTEKIGQLFMHYAYGDSADTTNPEDVERNQELHGVDNAAEMVDTYHLGGVIYFGWSDNLQDPAQVAELSNGVQDAALGVDEDLPLLVATDQEQGMVTRIPPPATEFPGNMALGAARSTDDAMRSAEITGRELRAMGINQDFAPVADVNVNPANPVIGVRSFSSDPGLASKLTAAQVEGYQSAEDTVTAAAKHFPGHGDTHLDSHTDLPEIDHTREEWEELDAPPFRAAIESGVDSVMSAHIVFPALDDSGDPATLSEPILTGLLREEMGFDGLVATDSLGMQGVRELYPDDEIPVRALQAGVDLMVMPADLELAINSVEEAVESGELTEDRIDASASRVLRLKHMRGVIDAPHVDPDELDNKVGTPEHTEDARTITDKTTTLVANDDQTLPLADDTESVLVTGSGEGSADNLAGSLSELGVPAESHDAGTNPDDAAIAEAVDRAGQSDAAVVVTDDAANNPGQAALVEALRATDTPVTVVGAGVPYDVNQFPEAETYVATYSSTPTALLSAARAITAETQPTGKLPVSIPRDDDSGEPLYEFGHGLEYS